MIGPRPWSPKVLTGRPRRASYRRRILQLGRALACAAAAWVAGCGQNQRPAFQHDVESERKPWTSASFGQPEGDFTFAIFSDLNGGSGRGSFPWPPNSSPSCGPSWS